MEKTRFYLLVLLVLIISLPACENQLRKRVMFSIVSIIPDGDVIAQGKSVNITATFSITGSTNEPGPSVVWESDLGTFESSNLVSTIWTAPKDFIGDAKIKLTATFMGHTDIAERVVRIVKTPAAGWGSLSGYVHNANNNPLSNVIIVTSTGEGDTTDVNGYFYITALPQGESGLNFSNISYLWATELSPQIEVTGGNHQHLGNIIFTTSTPAEISSFQVIPERHAILNIEHKNLNLINFHELYRADNLNGDGAKLVQIIESDITEIQVQEEVTDAFYALKSIPINGQKSPYSEWTHVPLVDVIDPDPAGSFFIYNNFFSATLNWQLTGYEDYYKGFRVVEDLDTGWAWVSPLLGVGTQSYQLNTEPGQTGNYYVLAISINDLYNTIQSEEQKIDLNVPSLLPPGNFDGRVQQDYSIRLFWEPVTNNDAWYGGYAIEKKVVTDSSTIDWEELTRIPTSVTSEFTDVVADSGNVYHYRISSVAYPPEPRGVFYSETDSISLSTK